MTNSTATAVDPIVQRLNVLATIFPELKEPTELYATILPLLRDNPLKTSRITVDPGAIRPQLEKKMPLLDCATFALDEWEAGDLLIQVTRGLEQVSHRDPMPKRWLWLGPERRRMPRPEDWPTEGDDEMLRATSARQIRLLLEQKRLPASELLTHAARLDVRFVLTLAEQFALDAGLLWMIAEYALLPIFRAWRDELQPTIGDIDWEEDFCPICGADARLGELRGNEQAKYLRCTRCGADWRVRRVRCVHCGNDDPDLLGYLYPEGQRETLRVDTCDHCHGYLKVLIAFAPTAPEMLLVEDLGTLYLDLIAQERGYTRSPQRPDNEPWDRPLAQA